MTTKSSIEHVSDTAVWMATYRALETKRQDALFRDPLAEILVGDRGQAISNSMKGSARYSYWTLVIRTRIIDDFILTRLKQGYKTVINLGAGLDTRPYRMNLKEDLRWIEIDFPHVIELKNQKLQDNKPRCLLERIPLDLSNRSARQNLFQELNEKYPSAILLTEGVIPYLTEDMVNELAQDLYSFPNFKIWITEYYSPELYSHFQAPAFARSLGNSPFRFYPRDWFGFFENQGWIQEEMRYLYDEGEKLNRKFPSPLVRFLKLIFNAEKIARKVRLQGYVVLKKK